MQLLLEKGADVNAQAGDHGSLLHRACNAMNLRMVQLLLDKSADCS